MIIKKKPLLKRIKPKAITSFKTQIRSRHPSHSWLRINMPKFSFRSIVRLGSTLSLQEAYPTKTVEQRACIKEINSVQGVKNSSSKLLMKQCFTSVGVKTANWYHHNQIANIISWANGEYDIVKPKYPIIAKSHYGSRGIGNTKLNNKEELIEWSQGKVLSSYIFEKFYTYSKEYRLHVTNNGCFYTCRKLVRNDAPENTWQRHDDVCVWILEDNEAFKKPSNWNAIVADCIKAKNALGLDICAFDVLVQASSKEVPEWLILESCSAPSFGLITREKYREELIHLLQE